VWYFAVFPPVKKIVRAKLCKVTKKSENFILRKGSLYSKNKKTMKKKMVRKIEFTLSLKETVFLSGKCQGKFRDF